MMDKRYLYRGFHPDENGNTIITFNGKKIKGEWVYGSYLEHEKSIEWIEDISPDGKTLYSGGAEVIPETVGQWVTTDKNGKDVFCDDLVKDCYGRILKIVYMLFGHMLELISYDKTKKWTNNFRYANLREWFDDNIEDRAELIGNKWECAE